MAGLTRVRKAPADVPLGSGSQIRIGKQITRRLRARYVYSVFNRTGGLQLRYQVTDRLSLQTEAGAETSAIDVLWEWQSKVPGNTKSELGR